ncbi:MAG: 50S ribosomal protein L2 [Cytophagales bacterium]|jgi:large subunit ribosomal protein L2|nr:50S ribosomal protein L2 [Cytophagales bacterium]
MSIINIKPSTPGRRFKIIVDYRCLTKNKKPEKHLLLPLKKTGGRNSTGRVTVKYKGGGTKKKYRVIDFKRKEYPGVPGTIKSIEYDPNRNAFISAIYYDCGVKKYVITPDKLKVGSRVVSGSGIAPEIGNALPLKEIPTGTFVHNIELNKGAGGVLVRSAGTSAQITAKEGKYVFVKLPSGKERMVLGECMATVGTVSNKESMNCKSGKAGDNRHLGIRPRTRCVAMNPVDHPMGGGEGKASGGHPRSGKGILAKGEKTRKSKRYSNKFLLNR